MPHGYNLKPNFKIGGRDLTESEIHLRPAGQADPVGLEDLKDSPVKTERMEQATKRPSPDLMRGVLHDDEKASTKPWSSSSGNGGDKGGEPYSDQPLRRPDRTAASGEVRLGRRLICGG
ncbi:unnamed protein product [Microthlaspi erraticum]|uniref:Uncharacterized protein n=1 Tax=Microthlaspi erraticum TaxID=1685480 RepID=A0A6D2IVZ4_9BRAS|nr:unnamed protein product [Microthlaspi erraticum]